MTKGTGWYDLIRALRAAGWTHTVDWCDTGRDADGAPWNDGVRQHRWQRGTELISVFAPFETGPPFGYISYEPDETRAEGMGIDVDTAVERGPTWLRQAMALCGILPAPTDGDFYEEDEPIEDVLRAFGEGEHGLTAPPATPPHDDEFEATAAGITRDWMKHLGYEPDEIAAAEAADPHVRCASMGPGEWQCFDENGRSLHPAYDEMDRTAALVMFVLEHDPAHERLILERDDAREQRDSAYRALAEVERNLAAALGGAAGNTPQLVDKVRDLRVVHEEVHRVLAEVCEARPELTTLRLVGVAVHRIREGVAQASELRARVAELEARMPEGICGDECPVAVILPASNMPPTVCVLTHGHASEWHEDERRQRWRHLRDAGRDRMRYDLAESSTDHPTTGIADATR